jgi:hypothetical protein
MKELRTCCGIPIPPRSEDSRLLPAMPDKMAICHLDFGIWPLFVIWILKFAFCLKFRICLPFGLS